MADYKNYKKTTDKLKSNYRITSDPFPEPFVHRPLPERAENGFSGCAGNAHGHAINCASVHRYRGGSWWLSGRSSDFSR